MVSLIHVRYPQNAEIAELRQECAELRHANQNLERQVREGFMQNVSVVSSRSCHIFFLWSGLWPLCCVARILWSVLRAVYDAAEESSAQSQSCCVVIALTGKRRKPVGELP